jgi:purine nucleosidase
LCRFEALLSYEEMAQIRGFNTPLATFAIDCNRRALEAGQDQSGDPGLGLADPVAMAVALDPTICTRKTKNHVDIETQSELTRGMTVVDQLGVSTDERNRPVWRYSQERGNVTVCWTLDAPRWKEALYSVLR